jgi:hypothetical protein
MAWGARRRLAAPGSGAAARMGRTPGSAYTDGEGVRLHGRWGRRVAWGGAGSPRERGAAFGHGRRITRGDRLAEGALPRLGGGASQRRPQRYRRWADAAVTDGAPPLPMLPSSEHRCAVVGQRHVVGPAQAGVAPK